jgi:3-isopropylmalate dehydrogenase
MRYSFNMAKEADQLEAAIAAALDKGLRTADIKSEGCKIVSTAEMGEVIVGELEKL